MALKTCPVSSASRLAPCLVSAPPHPPPRLPRAQQLVCLPGLGSGLRKLALDGHVSVQICPGEARSLQETTFGSQAACQSESWDRLRKGLGNDSKPEQGWRGKGSGARSDPGAGEALGV